MASARPGLKAIIAVTERSRPAIGHWTTADGTRHTGIIPAPPGHTTGMNHPVWINEAGQLTTPPKSPLHRGVQTTLAGTAVAAAITLIASRSTRVGRSHHNDTDDRYRNRPSRTPRCRCAPGRGARGP